MMMMLIFLVLSLEKEEVKIKMDLNMASDLLCLIMIHSWKVLVEAVLVPLNHLHLEEMVLEGLQNLLAQWQKQCNLLIYCSNGKTVTVKKTTIVNSDGSK